MHIYVCVRVQVQLWNEKVKEYVTMNGMDYEEREINEKKKKKRV